MADYGALTRKLVASTIQTKLGGLTSKVDFYRYISAGAYDPVADTTTPVYEVTPDVVVVMTKPTFKDTTEQNVLFNDAKLLVPGTSLKLEPAADADKVQINGAEWTVVRTVGVPGGSLYIVFVRRT